MPRHTVFCGPDPYDVTEAPHGMVDILDGISPTADAFLGTLCCGTHGTLNGCLAMHLPVAARYLSQRGTDVARFSLGVNEVDPHTSLPTLHGSVLKFYSGNKRHPNLLYTIKGSANLDVESLDALQTAIGCVSASVLRLILARKALPMPILQYKLVGPPPPPVPAIPAIPSMEALQLQLANMFENDKVVLAGNHQDDGDGSVMHVSDSEVEDIDQWEDAISVYDEDSPPEALEPPPRLAQPLAAAIVRPLVAPIVCPPAIARPLAPPAACPPALGRPAPPAGRPPAACPPALAIAVSITRPPLFTQPLNFPHPCAPATLLADEIRLHELEEELKSERKKRLEQEEERLRSATVANAVLDREKQGLLTRMQEIDVLNTTAVKKLETEFNNILAQRGNLDIAHVAEERDMVEAFKSTYAPLHRVAATLRQTMQNLDQHERKVKESQQWLHWMQTGPRWPAYQPQMTTMATHSKSGKTR
jgi:hypothetical protein